MVKSFFIYELSSKQFSQYIPRSQGVKHSIIFDGHRSHVSLSLTDWGKKHDIEFFILPPHTSYATQPLDVGCFDPSKAIYNSKCQTYMRLKVSKRPKIKNRYNQVPHLTQDTNRKVTNSQLDTTNESQEVSPFSAGDHKAHINRRAQRRIKHKTEQKHKRSTKEVPPWNAQ